MINFHTTLYFSISKILKFTLQTFLQIFHGLGPSSGLPPHNNPILLRYSSDLPINYQNPDDRDDSKNCQTPHKVFLLAREELLGYRLHHTEDEDVTDRKC